MRTVISVLLFAAMVPGLPEAQGEIIGRGSRVVIGENALTDLVAIAGGQYFSLSLRSDGTVVAWGRNDGGQCNLPASNADFVAVVGGNWHSVGLRDLGGVRVEQPWEPDHDQDLLKPPAGWNAVRWDGRDAAGRNVPTGVSLARMETESRVVSCRMVVVR